jgi:hypothetical protein
MKEGMKVRRSFLRVAGMLVVLFFIGLCGCRSVTTTRPRGLDAGAVETDNKAVGLMGQYKFGEARQIFAGLVREYPEVVDLRVNLAIATLNRQEEGDDERALLLLNEVLRQEPSHIRALYCSGLLELHRGRLKQAAVFFQKVVLSDPRDADAWYYLGQSLLSLDRYPQALDAFTSSIGRDPYLGSAYYGAFTALRHMGRTRDSANMMEEFRKLKDNPRTRQMEFKYTEMGRKAEVVAVGLEKPKPAKRPEGPLFEEGASLAADKDMSGLIVQYKSGSARPGMTLCDINGDGDADIFIPGALQLPKGTGNAIWLSGGLNGGYVLDAKNPLAGVADVNAALWGDIDNDGLVDVYLLRRGRNQLWRQTARGRWQQVPESAGAGAGDFNTVDGALFDADHDGDLDIFLVNSDGPNELLNNNRDGSFRRLGAENGLAGGGSPSRAVVVADLDNDRDADIIVVHERPPHEVYLNERFWKYGRGEGFSAFASADITAAVAGDVDADGKTELYTLDSSGGITRWRRGPGGTWRAAVLGREGSSVFSGSDKLALRDVDGDGGIELIVLGGRGWSVYAVGETELKPLFSALQNDMRKYAAWAVMSSARGPEILGWSPGRSPRLWPAGSGRYGFVTVALSGMRGPESNWRSNRSGIGARVSFRAGSHWTVLDTLRADSGPGQGLQPLTVGLAGEGEIDFAAIDWSDGVYQTELHLKPGRAYDIAEVQRQLSSCPVLFAWDGSGFRFVSDILGVGGVGYAVSPGNYAEPRPDESFLFPEGMLRAKDGRFIIKLTEPMEEITYLDSVRLTAYDLPPGWKMTLDERMAINPPWPTGNPVFYRTEMLPSRAMNERGEDVTARLAERDLLAAPPGELDRRFIGRLKGSHVLTLMFPGTLGKYAGRPVLRADGWIEYPYSQTNFAAWQADADYRSPSVEAHTSSGRWLPVLEQFGYPAGMPRQMSVPLPLPSGDVDGLRIGTNQEIYWDRLSVVFAEPCPAAKRHDLVLATADLEQVGFPRRSDSGQRLPVYDFSRRRPIWDTRRQEGYYTTFGPVGELLNGSDGAAVIFGPGESVHMEFREPAEPLPQGWSRVYVLTAHGWCKDMDLYTLQGDTVGPLPWLTRGEAGNALHLKYNTRFLYGTP